MLARSLVFLVGIAVGGGVVFVLDDAASREARQHQGLQEAPKALPAAALSCEGEVSPLKDRVRELEGRLAGIASTQSASLRDGETSLDELPEQANTEADDRRRQEAVKWRVSAIEKFVPLTAAQRDRLTEKFRREAESGREEASTEKLEDILGDEGAAYYRQQVKAAFQRVEEKELEKEVVWVSRQLSLSPEQEQSVRNAYVSIDQQVQQELDAQGHGKTPSSPQDRVKQMIQENKRRSELLNAQMKAILSPEQYQAFLQNEAESPSSDVEVFHDAG